MYRPAASGAIRGCSSGSTGTAAKSLCPWRRARTIPRLSPDGERVALNIRERLNEIWSWDLTRRTFDEGHQRAPHGRALRSGAVTAGRSFTDRCRRRDRCAHTECRRWLAPAPADRTDHTDGQRRHARWQARSSSPNPIVGDGINLRLLHLDGRGEAEDLIRTPNNEQNADVSPDGRWIAYKSDESGRNEVSVRPFPKVGAGSRQVSVSGGTRPLWSRDGRELFFLDPDRRMTVVDVRTGPSLTSASRRRCSTPPRSAWKASSAISISRRTASAS